MNLVLMTADDLSYTSTGAGGCCLANVTPTIDILAIESVWFENAHTVVSLCQPSRAVHMTGLYPWNNGSVGFCPLAPGVATIPLLLRRAGYFTGLIGKNIHYTPAEQFPWDFSFDGHADYRLRMGDWATPSEAGKDPATLRQATLDFLAAARRPYFLSVNCHQPHRPFPDASRHQADAIPVPEFLPDNHLMRQELARYYEAVSRLDTAVGHVLDLVRLSGEETIFAFTSDHGMAFPFSKAHCYPFSTRVPLAIWCPGRLRSQVNGGLVSTVDLFPTLLELLGIHHGPVNGRSLFGQPRQHIYTCLLACAGGRWMTRAVHDRRFCYVRNYWSPGQTFQQDGSLDRQSCVTALRIAEPERYQHLRQRTPEELFNLAADPACRTNLAAYRRLARSFAIETSDSFAIANAPEILAL